MNPKYVGWLLIWGFIWGLIGMAIGNRKGRGGWGFLAGMLLGPIGILLTLASSRNEKALRKEAIRRGKMKECPACAELVQGNANICRFCNTRLTGWQSVT